jgi:hypothetical protein
MQQHLAGTFDGQLAVLFDLAVVHLEDAITFDDQGSRLELAIDEGLAIENHALTRECFAAYSLHSRTRFGMSAGPHFYTNTRAVASAAMRGRNGADFWMEHARLADNRWT